MKRDDLTTAHQGEVEGMMIRALERRPEIAVPHDFAARIARSLPAKPFARPERRAVFGETAGYLAVLAMTVVLAVLAWRHPEAFETGKGFLFAVELLLIAQLLAVGFWLGTRSDG